MKSCLRFIITFSILILIGHTIFLYFNYTSNDKLIEDVSNQNQLIAEYTRLRHLNSTLAAINSELKALKSHMNDHIDKNQVIDIKSSIKVNEIVTVVSQIPNPTKSKFITQQPFDSSQQKENHYNKKALIFTMDSISSYEEDSKHGGAAGTENYFMLEIIEQSLI